jgi:hypothetical protein
MIDVKRIEKINELIKVIGSKGRKFLSSHHDDYDLKRELTYNYFIVIKSKLFLVDNYTKKEINMSRDYIPNTGFSSGGTMWGLMLDFANYIKTGNYSNHLNGYGGLYCPHWGYSEEDMKEIREFARSIGYLAKTEDEDHKYSRDTNDGKIIVLEVAE